VLGGNQSNQVNVQRYPVSQLLGVRKDPSAMAPTAVTVANTAPRTSPTQSRTVQGSAAQVGTAVAGGVTALAALDGQAQMIAIGVCAVFGLLALYVMRERLKKWSRGDR
jgi:hypothetical protein